MNAFFYLPLPLYCSISMAEDAITHSTSDWLALLVAFLLELVTHTNSSNVFCLYLSFSNTLTSSTGPLYSFSRVARVSLGLLGEASRLFCHSAYLLIPSTKIVSLQPGSVLICIFTNQGQEKHVGILTQLGNNNSYADRDFPGSGSPVKKREGDQWDLLRDLPVLSCSPMSDPLGALVVVLHNQWEGGIAIGNWTLFCFAIV